MVRKSVSVKENFFEAVDSIFHSGMLSSDDEDLALCVAERTMTICMNVMTLLNRPMNDSVYGLTSDNRKGGLILLNVTTSKAMTGLFALSSCETAKDRVVVTSRTTMGSCTMTYTFKLDDGNTYSFYDRHVNNETKGKKTNFDSSAVVPITKPIPIRASPIIHMGQLDDILTP